ncbi:MAG: hypothetical protein K6T75_07450 [Acetobacteraceae bacterium]|nr:hypothetical protein [Acetobacteraceae bacterium]
MSQDGEGRERKAEARKSAVLAFLCSLVPGGGHMYLGLMDRGLHFMVLFFGSLFLATLVGGPFHELWSLVIAPVAWFYSFFEALRLTAAVNRGQAVADRGLLAPGRGWVYVGAGLALAGLLALLENLDLLRGFRALWLRQVLLPAGLLGVGLWLLIRELRAPRRPQGPAGRGGPAPGPDDAGGPNQSGPGEGGGSREA